MELAKVTNAEEFVQAATSYRELLKDLTKAKSSDLKQLRQKLELFTNKHLIKVNKAAIKDKNKQSDLLAFLLLIDEHIPEVDFFQNAGLDLFPTLFKLTFYNQENSVINSGLGEGYFASDLQALAEYRKLDSPMLLRRSYGISTSASSEVGLIARYPIFIFYWC